MLLKNYKLSWAKLSMWKKRLEAEFLANFKMLEKVLYQDGVEIQNSMSISLKRELFERLETFQNSRIKNYILMALKLNHGSAILFLLI
jgi:hypothetical protein